MNFFNILTVFLSCIVFSINCMEAGEGRWFNRAYTSTVLETNVVTSLVPSSCVLVDATLPPCRNVRYLKFPHFYADKPFYNFNGIADVKPTETSRSESINTTPLGWGEYLGLYAPTVTITSTVIKTQIVQDPRIMVTFAVKGCSPLKLPMEINRCEQEKTSTITIEEILPTSTVSTLITPTTTSTYSLDQVNKVDNEAVNNGLNGSEGNFEENSTVTPTEPLNL